MTNKKLDPLRTFELEQGDWQKIREAVAAEGLEEWEGWVPAMVAAIELGFLDNHLQMLGKWMRERYLSLKDNGVLPAMYSEGIAAPKAVGRAKVPGGEGPTTADFGPVGPLGLFDTFAKGYDYAKLKGLLILEGEGVKPIWSAEQYTPERDEFVAKGWVFNKSDFVGRYFVSPVPFRPKALFRIDKVNRENFAVTCVASFGRGKGVGKNFRIETAHLYKLPS